MSKVRRDKAKEKNKKNRRQCATRIKIINANIEEEENSFPRIPAEIRRFLFAMFRRCNFYRQKKRENKNSF